MKTNIKILCLLLVAVMLIPMLFACGGEVDGEDGSDSDIADGTVDYDGKFPIFKDGEYVARVIMSDTATDSEKAVYSKLRTSLGNKTKSKVSSYTDYLKSGESYNKEEFVILVGKTNYQASSWIYGRTKADTYGMQVIDGNRLVIYFSTESEGLKLVNEFIAKLETDGEGYFWIDADVNVKKTTNFKLEKIPNYSSSTQTVDCGDDTTMLYAKNTNYTAYDEYCKTLKSNGYTEYSKRDDVNGNYYRIYTKGTMALNVYFTKSSSSVRIIAGPLDDIPTKDVDRTPEKNKKPSVTMLAQGEDTDCGLGLIIHLANGKFIIFDGGFSLYDQLYKKLMDIAPKGDRIVIAAWFVSHPHYDHQDAVTYFIQKHASSVDVENIFYNYGTSDYYKNATEEGNSTGLESVTDGLDSLVNSSFGRTTRIIKPHTGQVYNFGSASAEILYTVEDVMPSKLDYVNSSSLVVRFKVGDQTILALADATHTVSTILQNTYGSYLKSDIVQLAHHGTYPGHKSLYTKINASVLLWPSNTANAKARYSDDAVREAINKAKDVYLSKDTDVTLYLPYTVKNNKGDFLKSIGK